MQSVQQHSDEQTWYVTAWYALVKLDFIPAFFNWLMKALALITEPFASFSAIYIIIVAGVPALINNGLYTAAMALIIGSPELLIVGAFKIASRELAQGNKKAWWLMGACGVLLLLTALTVGDLFVWKWDQGSLNILMGVRCLAGIAYTFTRGIVTDEDEGEQVDLRPGAPIPALLESITETMREQIAQVSTQTIAEVQRLISEADQRQYQQFVTLVQTVKSDVQRSLNCVDEHNGRLIEGVKRDVQHSLATSLDTFRQENQTLLVEAVEQLERGQLQKIDAVYSRLEQVHVRLESSPSLPAVSAPRPQFRRPSVRVVSEALERGQTDMTSDSSADTDADGIDWRRVIADKLCVMPAASSQQMADAVGCSRSTAGKWLKFLREEMANAGN